MTERVAVVGMGQMGAGMAARLTESGFDVVGYDLNPARRQELAERQVAVADTLRAALAGRTTVLTSLPDPAAARNAWLGPEGIVALAEPGSLILELSTIDPGTMREIGAAAEKRAASPSSTAPSAAAPARRATAPWC